jgi:hypothetical protein
MPNNIMLSRSQIITVLVRTAFILILLISTAGGAMAYTLVFRDGHRIEVPSVFSLTPATLTYEAAPGINRTVQLILIDVAATERVNNEAAGAFFKHSQSSVVSPAAPVTQRASRTLTNRDLEASRQRRIESEKKYEQRRLELGLPSVEETRRQQESAEESLLNLARERALAEANDEQYWRSRASALRNEILSVDGSINYLRALQGPVRALPFTPSFVIGSGFPGRTFLGGVPTRHTGAGRMGTVAASPAGTPNLTNTGAVALRQQRPAGDFHRPLTGSTFPLAPFSYAGLYEGPDLDARLNALLLRRAGLDALWRELENEARAAKVPQVWLAPY